MQALLPIISEAHSSLVVVVSAMGKTTNALEEIVRAACSGDKDGAHALAITLEHRHLDYARGLLKAENIPAADASLAIFFTELQWAIDDADGLLFLEAPDSFRI